MKFKMLNGVLVKQLFAALLLHVNFEYGKKVNTVSSSAVLGSC